MDSIIPAPEALEGSYDEKIDIWGLGIIIYQLVTGKEPYEIIGRHELLEEIKNTPIKYEDPNWDKISPELKKLTQNMLCRNPHDRYSA